MRGYLLRRLLQVPLGLLVIGSLAFLLVNVAPGGPVTALSFIGIVDSDFGVAWNLDNVSVTEVPEPSSGVLAGAALLMTLTATRTLRGTRAWSLLPARRR